MELDNLKEIWQEESKALEARIAVNENIIRKMNLDKTVGEFDILVKRSLLGRNLALVYCFISVVLAARAYNDLAYSVPALLAGGAMLWSFISHLAITRPAYDQLSVVALQKLICAFRIHTAENAVYDIAIVSGWLLTLLPLMLKVTQGVAIYSNTSYTMLFFGSSIVVIVLIAAFSRIAYGQYNQKLKEAEAQLNTILEFEK
ncbi:hypothetical protein KK062_09250 [Fulvivirgaceae bacterium PWU5]|uniref:Uncharacterized protein n=1 Tax=Dawidia cretensis TaxID=2782350 RepID=A0AAP2DZ21_9BACT|nr:hypothetical protein [Dawidia cretensis]MBT1708409.1 hypothetical protein [Dawidia cretensis]